MLNIDWFRPYKHTPYSVGVIYMVITNLPRSIRFKKENVILVGIVPGPSEPPLHMNSYLKPLVDELNSLWSVGLKISSPDIPHPVSVKAALICVACDIPACRKVLGFYGHMSRAGCSKCTKNFGFDGNKIDFGGFSECPLRSEHDHRAQAYTAQRQTNAAARDRIEREHGSWFSSLMELPYFDTVRCHVVDPMHNLFLGTTKYVMKQILDTSSSNSGRNTLIQERVDKCIVPSSLGRIPHKIASAFSSLTADQWKTWTNVFSIYALYDILSDEQLECWRLFVQASRLLSSPMITTENADLGHKKLLDFCTAFEAMSGSETVTPNMHLHTHLLSCIKDYGPIIPSGFFPLKDIMACWVVLKLTSAQLNCNSCADLCQIFNSMIFQFRRMFHEKILTFWWQKIVLVLWGIYLRFIVLSTWTSCKLLMVLWQIFHQTFGHFLMSIT